MDLVTDPITKITGTAVVTADGVEREVDAIVVATGFYTTEQPIADHITGAEGRTLAEVWSEDGMAAYKGTTIHGFPNLFQIVGPNTGLGHSSMVFVIESQIAYIVDALRRMRTDRLASVQPTARLAAQVERRPPAQARPQRVEHRRLLELVPRRPRPQHHALAAHDVHVPAAAVPLRRRAVRHDHPLRRTRHHRPEGERMRTLDGKVVVITGAGSGIGRALALEAAGHGALPALSDWDEVGLMETAAARAGAHQPGAAHRQARRARPGGHARPTPSPSPATSAGST